MIIIESKLQNRNMNLSLNITGKKVKIDDGYGGKITVGYVSEIKDSSSGLQVYVVTDIKLPEQPTAADYEKVTHVTLLYRGVLTPKS